MSNRDGLTAVHILLARLMDLSGVESKPIEDRPASFETDDKLQESINGFLPANSLLSSK